MNTTTKDNPQKIVEPSSVPEVKIAKYESPKNALKISQSVYDRLSIEDKHNYEKILKKPKKAGYAVVKQYYNKFYRIHLIDFFPLFLGYFFSYIRFAKGYGDLKSNAWFDKTYYKKLTRKAIFANFFTFLINPLLLIGVMILFQFCMLGTKNFTTGYIHLNNDVYLKKPFFDILYNYFQNTINPLFQRNVTFTGTIIFLILLPMVNLNTIVYKIVLSIKRKNIFKMQKEHVKDTINRINIVKKHY